MAVRGTRLARWWARMFCSHDWRLVDEHKEPGLLGKWGANLTPTHRAQTYVCARCGAYKVELVP